MESDDERTIRQIEQKWDEAWNLHDAQALAALLAEDVDFVNVTGAWFKGRAEFDERMAQTHRGVFKTSKRATTETTVKFLTHEIAVVHARWQMSGIHDADGSLREPWEGIITRVVKKIENNWIVVAAHNVDLTKNTVKPFGL